MSFLQEFKEFAMKGNVVDMAVGVIIGGAFGKIIASLVANIIMPPVGLLMGGVSFSELRYVLAHATLDSQGAIVADEIAIQYGLFLQVTLDFIIVALCVFLLIKGINQLKRKEKEATEAKPPKPSAEETLLTEIRDLLKK